MHKVCPLVRGRGGRGHGRDSSRIHEQQFCVSRVMKQRFHASQNFEVVQSASIIYNLTRVYAPCMFSQSLTNS